MAAASPFCQAAPGHADVTGPLVGAEGREELRRRGRHFVAYEELCSEEEDLKLSLSVTAPVTCPWSPAKMSACILRQVERGKSYSLNSLSISLVAFTS